MKTPAIPSGLRAGLPVALAATLALGAFAQTTSSPSPKPQQPPGSPPPPVPAATPPGPADPGTGREKTVSPLQELALPPANPGGDATVDFSSVDAELAAIERQIANAPSEDERDAAKVRYASLKDRRDELKANFNRARFELFKSDVSSESSSTKEWRGENPAAAGGNNHPSVARLDIDLKLLRSRAEMMEGDRKTELTRKLQDFERRRNALEQNFNQSEFETLQREIQSEWDRVSR